MNTKIYFFKKISRYIINKYYWRIYITDYLQFIDKPDCSFGFIIGIAVLTIIIIIITANESDYDLAFLFAMCACIMVGIVLVSCLSYFAHIEYTVHRETYMVQQLPNNIITGETSCFIVNGKEIKTKKNDSTKYVQDSKDKPYIIAEKVKYKVQPKFYLDKDDVKKINNTAIYILKEVHY